MTAVTAVTTVTAVTSELMNSSSWVSNGKAKLSTNQITTKDARSMLNLQQDDKG